MVVTDRHVEMHVVVMAPIIAPMPPIRVGHGMSMAMPVVAPATVVTMMAVMIVVTMMRMSPAIACLSGRCSHEPDRADSRAEQRSDAPEHKSSKRLRRLQDRS